MLLGNCVWMRAMLKILRRRAGIDMLNMLMKGDNVGGRKRTRC